MHMASFGKLHACAKSNHAVSSSSLPVQEDATCSGIACACTHDQIKSKRLTILHVQPATLLTATIITYHVHNVSPLRAGMLLKHQPDLGGAVPSMTCKRAHPVTHTAAATQLLSIRARQPLRAPCERAGAAAGTGAARVEGGLVVCQLPEAPLYLPVPAYH